MKDVKITDFPINSSNPYRDERNYAVMINPNKGYAVVNMKEISKLSKSGLKVLEFITEYNSNTDYVGLASAEVAALMYMGIVNSANRNFVYRGIVELLSNGVIAKSVTKDYYWLNRNVI